MSVPKSKRKQSELDVLVEADTLATYTIKLCTNEKKFPKRYRWCITQQIVSAAVSVAKYTSMANAIVANTEDSFLLRQSYQQHATAEIDGLLTMMDISYRTFSSLRNQSDTQEINMSHWSAQAHKVRSLLFSWKKSDKERYKKAMANS